MYNHTRGFVCNHVWIEVAHISNLRIFECDYCFLQRREEGSAEDTLSQRLKMGYYSNLTKVDPDLWEQNF